MKSIIPVLFVFLHSVCFGELAEGFDKQEARDMIAICNSFTFIDLYESDEDIIPTGYTKIYTSGVFGMDNKYQVYEKGDVAVINLRGSTDKQISWLENMYSAMIPAKGSMKVDGERFNYTFANQKDAAVHSGYAIAIAFLKTELLHRIENVNRDGIYNFIITGHSQGGALANMLKAYLENLPGNRISSKNKFKVYAFAAPMAGNRAFAAEYNERFGNDNSSFNIVNPADMIPSFPLNYNDTNYVEDNLKSFLFDRESFSFKKMIADGSVRIFEGSLGSLISLIGSSASKKIGKEVGPVELPPYVKDINFFKLENRIEISPFAYPKILKDSSILRNDSLMAIYKRDNDGNFVNDELYKKGSWTYQHKPYNYYVSILKTYFPEDFQKLKMRYLPENI